ncbi:MAG: DUF4886 domain-containing protein [Kiritimatiellia bacterium]|nr:DUF4886 domain-containing protein [Kiritimatiellia bacterium]MDP6847624.1 DUF4886 domain-containing protein [Kiritimatiellia bacterium]
MNRTMIPVVAVFAFMLVQAGALAREKKVLMLGNSYSSGTAHWIKTMFTKESAGYKFTVLSPGGKDLQYHANAEATLAKLKSEKWDVLIMQGQSLQTAATPAHPAQFQQQVTALVELAREHNVPRIMLFQTWGRRDGHKQFKDAYPDFQTMHRRVSEQYGIAGEKNKVEVVPVGTAFAVIHKEHDELFRGLYKKDGSHPSPQAGYMAACVFYGAITGNSPLQVKWDDKLPGETAAILKKAAAGALTM